MLSSDLVRARRRGEKLNLQALSGADREEALGMARALLEIAQGSLGESAEELGEALNAIDRDAKHEKLWAGLKKLVLDRCSFGMPLEIDAPALRKQVFEKASVARRELGPEDVFSRDKLLGEVASELGVDVQAVEDGLFGDLKGAQRLTQVPVLNPEQLIEEYEVAQIQGILLKAVRMKVHIRAASPDMVRSLFQKLKFRQLLYRVEKTEAGVEVEIEGPFSLFESVTKYGVQLAMIVPALLACDHVELEAELRWGKERRKLSFATQWKQARREKDEGAGLRSDVSALMKALEKKKSPWNVSISREILHIPGVGLCVPDLRFEAPGREAVFVEVLGFWSREAVWKRVEWAQSQEHEKVVFAVSSRLRVSEEVLPEDAGASLYVYKRAMSALAVLKQVEELAGSKAS